VDIATGRISTDKVGLLIVLDPNEWIDECLDCGSGEMCGWFHGFVQRDLGF